MVGRVRELIDAASLAAADHLRARLPGDGRMTGWEMPAVAAAAYVVVATGLGRVAVAGLLTR